MKTCEIIKTSAQLYVNIHKILLNMRKQRLKLYKGVQQ